MKKKENKSYFLEYFGDTPQLRVIDFLIGNYFFDFPMTEIARGSNVSYNSIKLFFPKYVKQGIMVKMRKVGKSDYFKLNIEHPFIKEIMKLDWIMTKTNVLLEDSQDFKRLSEKRKINISA